MILVQKSVAHPCVMFQPHDHASYVARLMMQPTIFTQSLDGQVQAIMSHRIVPDVQDSSIIKLKFQRVTYLKLRRTKIGNKSITIYYEMKNIGNNEVAATLQVISVLFDLQTRESVVISENLKVLLQNFYDKA